MKPGILSALVLTGVARAAAPAPSALPARDWQASVTRAIVEGEYHLSWSDKGSFTAPNRANDFRTSWTSDGVFTLGSRNDAKAWSFSYRLRDVGRGPRTHQVSEARHENVSGGRVDWQRDGLREFYVNDARGIGQGFLLESRPPGDARHPVIIEGAVDGLLAFPADDGQSIVFRTPSGRDAIRVRELSVTDSSGNPVTACFEVGVGSLAIVVADNGAPYPLTVGLLMTSPAWTAEGNQTFAAFGTSVATAGDVNADGYSDVIIGAFRYENGEIGEGRVFVYHGSAAGLATTPAWTAEGDQEYAAFGSSVATAGDVNGDGYADVIVGAPGYDNGELDEGGAFVYLGSASGLATTPAWTAEGNQNDAALGYVVMTAGDVNGDGYADVIAGAPYYDNGELQEGRASVYFGSVSGLSSTAAWTAESDQASAWFGTAVASGGDVNGDGYADVVVGARYYKNGEFNEGGAFLYLGSAAGLGTSAAWMTEGNQDGAELSTVAAAGDVNGDGYGDVVVGAWKYGNGQVKEGRALLYLGSATGLASTAAWTAESNQADAWLGLSVGTAGDVNGDGYADVIVGAHYYTNTESHEGRASLYLGSRSGLRSVALWSVESDQIGAEYGFSVATAGDVNGDGYSDVVVGAPGYDNPDLDEGRAFVYLGAASGIADAPAWSADGNLAYAHFGTSVATAGDVNGDGYSDVIVGCPGFDNGELDEGRAFAYLGSAAGLATTPAWIVESDQAYAWLGASVASAGDVNGDGYSDVIVGAPRYANGEVGEGRAVVYLGSAAGLAAMAAWTGEGDQANANFAVSVATAGDVNRDGYSDVIVGADKFTTIGLEEGRAFVYLGSSSGLATIPRWTGDTNQRYDGFGHSVATAGDVNGDGFSDVIVGAPYYDNGEDDEGRAFVYLGSAFGPGRVAAWIVESDQVNAVLGISVATAGDVNGDGFSDVIVGAPYYDNGEADEGRASVYLGSASGLATTAAWTAESDQVSAAFADSVASAGDVNGDGYSDVVVGDYRYDSSFLYGRAFVYLGSGSGPAATPAWIEALWFGFSVATAGDVNGDGYSDVIVGAPDSTIGSVEEGRAFVFYGNDAGGLERIPRQARADGSGPIDLLGGTLSTDGFRLRANGRSPFGRDHVRLEWEVKPVATPFDGADIRASSWFDTGAPGASGSVVPLDELNAPLSGPGPFHWRLRLRANSPVPWQSHWMSLPYNAITETDLLTETNATRCDLDYADLTFPPLAPAKVAAWVYTQTCAGGDVLPTLLLAPIVSGSDIDTLGGGPGTLRFYQLSCGCADGIKLTKRAGMVRLDTF